MTSPKQANKAIDAQEASLNVNSAKTADNATTAATATNANAVDGVSATRVSLALEASTGATVFQGSGLTLTAACSAGQALPFNATTTTEANFGAGIHELTGNTFEAVNETNGLFDVGDDLNPVGAASTVRSS